VLINSSIQQVYLCRILPAANDYTSHIQDATTVELTIKQCYYLGCNCNTTINWFFDCQIIAA